MLMSPIFLMFMIPLPSLSCVFVAYHASLSRNLAEILPPRFQSKTESLGNTHQ